MFETNALPEVSHGIGIELQETHFHNSPHRRFGILVETPTLS